MDNLNLLGNISSIIGLFTSFFIPLGFVIWNLIKKTKISRFNLYMWILVVMNVILGGIWLWLGEILAAAIAGIAFMLILLYWSVQSQFQTQMEIIESNQKSIRRMNQHIGEMDQKIQKILQLFMETLDVYDRKYDFDKDIEYFNKLIALNPKYAEAYHNRGVAYIDKGDFEKALEDLDTAIALNEACADAYYTRAKVWLYQEQWQNAKTDLTTAKDNGCDIRASFHKDYESLERFEAKNWIYLPPEIVVLLQQPPVKQVIYNAVQQLTGGDTTLIFTNREVEDLISAQNPHFRTSNVDAELRADCVNNPARDRHYPDSSNYDYYWRVSRGHYRLYDPETDIVLPSEI